MLTPERWQKVRDLLEQALELAPEKRSRFLDVACSSDPALRSEVQSLLSSDEQARTSFLETPPVLPAALSAGTRLGDYEIVCQIGSGGMGVVYRARDTRLGRDVAIKVLPAHLSSDASRLKRFEQEAQSAAALNHPNILAVYQLGSYQGAPYLVSELLEGETLREHLKHGLLSQERAMDYAQQIADGLSAAHERNIIHRDLKPENLFITNDNRIKILDFGLAKLAEADSGSAETVATLGLQTHPGMMAGTVGYMSPEQVRGEKLDTRTDLFSFGVVLYEMATGKRPFDGDTSGVTFEAILNRQPTPPTKLNAKVAPGLENIITKALEKDREIRYQHASDIRADLKRLKRDSGFDVIPSGKSKDVGTLRKTVRIVLPAFFLAVLLSAFILFQRTHRQSPGDSKWLQLTNFADSATSPALSSDGRMITFIRGPETFVSPGQIYVKLLPDGQPFPVTHDNYPKMAPVFSPDGTRVAYTATDASFGWNTWMVPVLGGEPREVLPNAAALTWIDQKHVLFSEIKSGVQMAIVMATEARSEERDVYLPSSPGGMAHRSWLSPDGKWVLISEMDSVGWRPCRLLAFDSGSVGETVGPPSGQCTYAGWSPDGKWMYFSANAGDGFHIWRQHFTGGTPQQVTFGPTEQEGIAVAPDGRSLVASAGINQGSVWFHDTNGDRQISFEGNATLPGLGFAGGSARSVFSPDGAKLFYLLRKDTSRSFKSGELWLADLQSEKSEPVFPGILMSDFDISSDGKRIAFTSLNGHESPRVWIAALDHSTPPKEVTSAESDGPSFGDGNTLFFRQREAGTDTLCALEPNDTIPRKISTQSLSGFVVQSPDRAWWLVQLSMGAEARPVAGGPGIRICDFCQVGWGSDGKYFYIRLRDIGVIGKGKLYVVELPVGKSLPVLPASGIRSAEDLKQMHIVSVIDTSALTIFAPGPDPSTYAYTRMTVQRNLFRIPLN